MIPPTKAADPVEALCQVGHGAIVTYRVGSATAAMTDDDAAAMRCAINLSDGGRVHLLQSLISRNADGIGTYAYIAIGRPQPGKLGEQNDSADVDHRREGGRDNRAGGFRRGALDNENDAP